MEPTTTIDARLKPSRYESGDARLKPSRYETGAMKCVRRATALAEPLRGLCVPWLVLALALLAPRIAAAQRPPAAANSCLTCHATQTDARIAAPATLFTQADIHRESGLACANCHG